MPQATERITLLLETGINSGTNLFVGINTLVTFLGRSWLMRRKGSARETSLATRHSIFPIFREGSCYPLEPTALLETRNFQHLIVSCPFYNFV